MEHSVFVIIAGSLIILVAFFIRSLSGIGSALLSIPLLALFFDLKFVVPLEALFEVGFSLILVKKIYKNIRIALVIPLLIGAIIGSLIGVYFLHSLANAVLKKALGLVVILSALTLLRKNNTNTESNSSLLGFVAGTTGGVLGGLFGTSGPPITWYLAYKLKEKDILRATLIGVFTIDFAWRVGIYSYTGLITPEVLKFALILTPALVLGTILGHHAQTRISDLRFRQIVAVILSFSGMLLLIR